MRKHIMYAAISIGLIVLQGLQSGHAQSWNLTGNAGTSTSTNFIGTTDAKAFKVRTNNVVRITVNSSGKVGIGNNSPAFKLDVKNGSINTDSLYRISGVQVLTRSASNSIQIGDATAKIGIGISSPVFKLDVKGGSINTDSLYRISGVQVLTRIAPNNIQIGDSISKVGIGTSTPGFKLDVKGGSINSDSVYRIQGNTVLSVYGTGNTFAGIGSGFFNFGYYNTGIGNNSLYSNSGGRLNTASGYFALYTNTTGSSNTAHGVKALISNLTGNFNTATGLETLNLNSIGSYNTAIGAHALYTNSIGSRNTASGYTTLFFNTLGFYNTASGEAALYNNTTGDYNTASGRHAMLYNTEGSLNSAMGSNAYFNGSTLDNTTCIGYNSGGVVNMNNRIEIGNTSVTVIAGQVGWSTYSDARIKENIKSDVPGMAFISKLRPVTYNLNIHKQNEMVYSGKKDEVNWNGKYDIEKIKMTGFLAQEVEQAAKDIDYNFSGVQKPANPNELYSIRYSDFVMPLVIAVQELNEKLQRSEVRSQKLEEEVEILKSKIQSQTSDLRLPASDFLEQNAPNPFTEKTIIKFNIPATAQQAVIKIYTADGRELKAYSISTKGAGQIEISSSTLYAGIYNYTLFIDGKATDSRQMVLTR